MSSEEITLYEPVGTSPGGPIVLATRLSTKQTILIAGRNLLLEKEQWFSDFRIDAPEFELERQAARGGPQIMFRETDLGVRYLVKRGLERVVSDEHEYVEQGTGNGNDDRPDVCVSPADSRAELSEFRSARAPGASLRCCSAACSRSAICRRRSSAGRRSTRASISSASPFPAPICGSMLSASGWTSACSTIPMSTGVNLGYQFTPFHKITAGYVFRYDAYFHAPETAEDFAVPSGTATNGADRWI